MTERLPLFEGEEPGLAAYKVAKVTGRMQGARHIGERVSFVVTGRVVGVNHSVDKDGVMVRTHAVEAAQVVELNATKGQELINELQDSASGQTRLEMFADAEFHT